MLVLTNKAMKGSKDKSGIVEWALTQQIAKLLAKVPKDQSC